MSSLSKHSPRTERIQRSATAFALGACTGVRMIVPPSDVNGVSQAGENFAVVNEEMDWYCSVLDRPTAVPRLLRHPSARWA